jgi:hypothetical protein
LFGGAVNRECRHEMCRIAWRRYVLLSSTE